MRWGGRSKVLPRSSGQQVSGGAESVKSASRRRAVDRRSLIVRLELW